MARHTPRHTQDALHVSMENSSPRTIWSAAVFAGFMGALAFFVWEILTRWWIAEQTPWVTVRLIASIALGAEAARASIENDLSFTLVAAAVHLALSICFACLIAPLLRRFSRSRAIFIGLGFGAALYIVDFYIVAPTLFPWTMELRDGATFIGHLVFGTTVAGVYGLAQGAHRKSREALHRE